MAAKALDAARETLAQARPLLLATELDVEITAYSQAAGVPASTRFSSAGGSGNKCSRFAAYVTAGDAHIYLCPQFFTPGAERLRELTVLHELVHVVAGPDECRAIAFAARIQFLATGTFTPVTQYWQQNQCKRSIYRLP